MIFPTPMVGNKGRLFLQALLWKGFSQLNLAHMRDNVILRKIVSYTFCQIFYHLGGKKKKKEQGHGYLNQVIITLVKCNAEKPVAVLLYLENDKNKSRRVISATSKKLSRVQTLSLCLKNIRGNRECISLYMYDSLLGKYTLKQKVGPTVVNYVVHLQISVKKHIEPQCTFA